MRKLLYLLVPMLIIFQPFVSYSEEGSTIAKPVVYGVLFYADWCGSCKALEPKVAQAREEAELDSQDILFVTLDLTNDATKHQASMMAAMLGVSHVYESNAGKTGFMLLLNAVNGEKLAQLTKKMEPDGIATLIQDTIESIKS